VDGSAVVSTPLTSTVTTLRSPGSIQLNVKGKTVVTPFAASQPSDGLLETVRSFLLPEEAVQGPGSRAAPSDVGY
jgi:hypothetical protein